MSSDASVGVTPLSRARIPTYASSTCPARGGRATGEEVRQSCHGTCHTCRRRRAREASLSACVQPRFMHAPAPLAGRRAGARRTRRRCAARSCDRASSLRPNNTVGLHRESTSARAPRRGARLLVASLRARLAVGRTVVAADERSSGEGLEGHGPLGKIRRVPLRVQQIPLGEVEADHLRAAGTQGEAGDAVEPRGIWTRVPSQTRACGRSRGVAKAASEVT